MKDFVEILKHGISVFKFMAEIKMMLYLRSIFVVVITPVEMVIKCRGDELMAHMFEADILSIIVVFVAF